MNSGLTTNARCASLTAAGRGAIAVVALRGDRLIQMVEPLFRPFNRKPFSRCLNQKLIYGVWQTTGEDVVVLRRATDSLEIHCHGGSAAVNSILNSLAEAGADLVSAEKMNQADAGCLWTHEVTEALSHATTQRTAGYLLQQLDRLPAAVANIDARIEAGDCAAAVTAIDRVLEWSEFGCGLTEIPSVVLCGRPNVGKSSLINAIVGFQRAIVHDTPGTTRDVVTQQTAVEGWPVELKDTAGLREAGGMIEQMGIENARRQIEAANVVIGVFDASCSWTSNDQLLCESLNPNLIVHNKSDEVIKQSGRPAGLRVSAKTGDGLNRLIAAIAASLTPQLPPASAAFCISPTQVERLKQLRASFTGDVEP